VDPSAARADALALITAGWSSFLDVTCCETVLPLLPAYISVIKLSFFWYGGFDWSDEIYIHGNESLILFKLQFDICCA
jgi:hypothetical protein